MRAVTTLAMIRYLGIWDARFEDAMTVADDHRCYEANGFADDRRSL